MRALMTLLLVAFSFSALTAQENVGSFDINKVRELSMSSPSLNDGSSGGSEHKESTNYALLCLRVIGSLAVIIGLIFGASWLLRKSGLGRTAGIGGGGAMEVVEVLPLGQSRNVLLFRLGESLYLCGQTASSLSLLDKIEGQRAGELMAIAKDRPSAKQFKDAFNQFIGKIRNQA